MCVCALMCYDLLPSLDVQVHLHDCVSGCLHFPTVMVMFIFRGIFLKSTWRSCKEAGGCYLLSIKEKDDIICR